MSTPKPDGEVVVQTTLPASQHRRLKRIAEERDLSIRAVTRQFLIEKMDEWTRPDPDSSFFKTDDIPLPDDAPETSAAEMDDDLYGE